MADDGQVSVSTTIEAPAERIHAMVSDVTRMGEWSPECVRCEWTDAEHRRFKGHNRNGARRWTTTGTVVANEPGREFAFHISSIFGLPVARWSYRFEAAPDDPGRTVVTEAWEDKRNGWFKAIAGLATGVPDRPEHNRKGMEETLARIKAAAEAGAG